MNKKVNVLIVTSEFPPEPGGIGNHACNLANQLTEHNYNVNIIADQRIKDLNKELFFDKAQPSNVVRIKLKKIRLLMYINRIINVFKAVSKNEVIFASGKFSLWSIALATFFYRKKFIAIIHGSEVNYKNKYLRKSIDISIKKFDKVIAVSAYTKSLIDYLNLKNIEVIPNGFNLCRENDFKEKRIKGNPSLITVGSVTERKGQKNVILALPKLLKIFPEIHYHIVGSPIEKNNFSELAKNLKVEKHITFHGKVSEKEKCRLLLESTIFVMLSENTENGDVEGFGIALLEANNMEIPVIGAKYCGIEDAIDNYKSGVLIDNKNHKEFISAIQLILNNYDKFKENSKSWSLKFTWDIIIKKYIKAINF
jgi:glycosyltransferase involved in cell wall biosynthesis